MLFFPGVSKPEKSHIAPKLIIYQTPELECFRKVQRVWPFPFFFVFWYMIKSIEHTERTTLCRVISEGLGSHFLPRLCVFVVLHLNG